MSRSEARSAGQRAGLSKTLVLEQALEIAAKEGVDQVSIRRLSRDLGVMPNAIYSYFADKDALVDAVVDSVFAQVLQGLRTEGDWKEALKSILERLRKVLVQHSQVVPLMLSRPTLGENSMKVAELCLASLADSGLDRSEAVAALRALTMYTFGFAGIQARRQRSTGLADRSSTAERTFADLPADKFPELARHAKPMAAHPTQAQFRQGITWILQGIEGQATPAE